MDTSLLQGRRIITDEEFDFLKLLLNRGMDIYHVAKIGGWSEHTVRKIDRAYDLDDYHHLTHPRKYKSQPVLDPELVPEESPMPMGQQNRIVRTIARFRAGLCKIWEAL